MGRAAWRRWRERLRLVAVYIDGPTLSRVARTSSPTLRGPLVATIHYRRHEFRRMKVNTLSSLVGAALFSIFYAVSASADVASPDGLLQHSDLRRAVQAAVVPAAKRGSSVLVADSEFDT